MIIAYAGIGNTKLSQDFIFHNETFKSEFIGNDMIFPNSLCMLAKKFLLKERIKNLILLNMRDFSKVQKGGEKWWTIEKKSLIT